MVSLKMTAKRQVTFPLSVCRALGISKGDRIRLNLKIKKDGKRICLLETTQDASSTWFGVLRKYIRGKKVDHSMKAIRKSIQQGRRIAERKKKCRK